MMPVLAFRDVAAVIGGARVLDAVDFTLEAGASLAIVGGSGSGKTTLARLAGGLAAPTHGTIDILGVRSGEGTALAEVRERIGMTLQGGSLFDELSIDDNLRLGVGAVSAAGWRALASRVDRLLYAFGLEAAADSPAGALSVGGRRQLEIVRALLRDPALLILDEPFEGAAAEATAMALAIRRSMRRHNGALLVLTQDRALAGMLADHRFELRQGCLVQQSDASTPARAPSATASTMAATLA